MSAEADSHGNVNDRRLWSVTEMHLESKTDVHFLMFAAGETCR